MARRKGKFIRGVIGPVKFYVRKNKQIISNRTAKGTVKHSENSKKAQHTFGMSTHLGSKIREAQQTNLNGFSDGEMGNRFNRELIQILNQSRNPETRAYDFEADSFSRLVGFEFNDDSKLGRLMAKLPSVDFKEGVLSIQLPKLKIPTMFKFPFQSFRCRITLSVTLLRLKEGFITMDPKNQSVEITKDKATLSSQTVEFNVPDGCLCLAGVFLEYFTANRNDWRLINGKGFNPGSICGALITSGVYKEEDGHLWTEMMKFE